MDEVRRKARRVVEFGKRSAVSGVACHKKRNNPSGKFRNAAATLYACLINSHKLRTVATNFEKPLTDAMEALQKIFKTAQEPACTLCNYQKTL